MPTTSDNFGGAGVDEFGGIAVEDAPAGEDAFGGIPVEAGPDLSKIKISPYDQAAIEAFRSGRGKPESGMESGTELTTALAGGVARAAAAVPPALAQIPNLLQSAADIPSRISNEIGRRQGHYADMPLVGEEREAQAEGFGAAMQKPFVALPKFTDKADDSILKSAGKEAANLLISIPEFIESPLGVLTMGAGMGGKLATTATRYAFAGDMVKSMFESAPKLRDDWGTLTEGQKSKAIVQFLGTAAMVGLLTHPEARGTVKDPLAKVADRTGQLAPDAIRLAPGGRPVFGAEARPLPTEALTAPGGAVATQLPAPAQRDLSPQGQIDALMREGPAPATAARPVSPLRPLYGLELAMRRGAEPGRLPAAEPPARLPIGSDRVDIPPADLPAPAPPGEAAKASPHDFEPALDVDGKMVTGGENHDAIKAKALSEAKTQDERNAINEAFMDDSKHVFIGPDSKPWTRERVSKALGEKDPIQSSRLGELQANVSAVDLLKMTPGQITAWKKRAKYGPELMQKMSDAVKPEDIPDLVAERDRLREQVSDSLKVVENGTLEERMKAAQAAQLPNLKAQTLNEMIENAPKPAARPPAAAPEKAADLAPEHVAEMRRQKGKIDGWITKLESLKSKGGAAGLASFPDPEVFKGIGSALRNTAIDVAIGVLKAGKSIGEAIDAAMAHIRERSKDFDETKLRIAFEKYLNPSEAEKGMPPGPGAQTAGTDTPEGSQLQQLSKSVHAQLAGAKEPFANRLRAALDLAGKWGKGKDQATAAVGRLVAAKDALWNAYMKLPPWDNFTAAVGRWVGADSRTALEIREFQKAIKRSVPSKLRREAITNWIQAEGDEGVLGSRMQASKPYLQRGYRDAMNLTDAEKTLGRNISSYFESRLQEGIDAGILRQGVDAYVTQIWDRPNELTAKLTADLFGAGNLSPNFKFAKKRIFASYFEGEQQGFIPKNKDIGHLIAVYDMAFNRALSARALIREIHGGKAKDGLPIAMTSGQGTPLPKGETPPETVLVKPNYRPKGAVTEDGREYRPIDHWALRNWKWASNVGDTTVLVQGDMLVHPDHWDHLNNVLKNSRLRQNPIGRAILATGSFAKQTKLSLSPFHTVQEGVHALAHRINPINPTPLDMADPVQKSLVDHGLMVADPRGYELFTEGMSGGGLVGKIPGLGALQQWYTEMTFKDYIPRLKMTMAKDALERNRQAYAKDIASGKVSDDQIVALTARESNAAFGEQNYKLMAHRSATAQDWLRMVLLAPDFLEARARFVGQALKPYGREQRIALALMGATLYTGGRVLNKALDDDYHWDKPFSVFSGGNEYRLRTILGDMEHLLSDPRSFWYNRLSPITRTAAEYLYARDDRGIKRNSMEQFVDFLSWFKPIPLQVRPGEGVKQAVMASAGVPGRPYSKQQELYEVLDKWRSKQADPKIKETYDRQRQETHVTSPYGPLRMALAADNPKQEATEYKKLLASRTAGRIRMALKANRPFTGSNAAENKFKAALTPPQRKLYAEAQAERERMLKRFDALPKGSGTASNVSSWYETSP